MEIRIRNTGEVMTEITFRTTFRDRVIPEQLTEAWLNDFNGGCDVVLEAFAADPRQQVFQVWNLNHRAAADTAGRQRDRANRAAMKASAWRTLMTPLAIGRFAVRATRASKSRSAMSFSNGRTS